MIWEQIAANRRRSAVLITVMALVLLLLGYVAGEAFQPGGGGAFGVLVAGVIWLLQMTLYFTSAESILLHGAYGRELTRDDNPRLYNVVEEMKLASGLPFMPRIFVIDDPAPNAFAIGGKPNNSIVAVTSGLLHRLNRDELQGVIAHEIGHLRNQDVRFMTLAAVMLGSIALLSELILRGLRFGGRGRSRDESRGGGGQLQLILLVLTIALALLGPLMAQLLYFACSRKREYLADASAAQYTRYPSGLASALEKISGSAGRPEFATKTTAPMFIINPLQASGAALSLFSTHPPTADRVRILRSMGGAGLADYEAAYARVAHGSLIGPQSLQLAPVQAIRQSSDEGPILNRQETRNTVYRQHGYVSVNCHCGLQMQVPQGFKDSQIRCIRCGALVSLPAAQAATSPAAPEQKLQYRRQHTGWESFRCTCGRTLQIGPAFSAPQIRCTGCGNRIEVR